jgi:hypothetical protein
MRQYTSIAVISCGVRAILLALLVYAPPSGRAAGDLVAAAAALRAALRAGGAEVMEGAIDRARAEQARGTVPAAELAFFARGAALVDEGRRALERVELERAEARLADAERVYAVEVARPGVAALYSEASLLRGVALFELGRATEARQAFRRAAALEPTAQLTEASVRPDVARAFAQAIATRGDGDLRNTPPASPPSPLRSDDPRRAALASLREAPSAAGGRALGELLGLDGVVVVALGVDAGALALVGQRLGPDGCAGELARVRVGAGGLTAAAGALVERLRETPAPCDRAIEVLRAPEVARPRPAPLPVRFSSAAPPPAPKRAPRLWERPWLWLGVVAVTTAAVGLAAGLGSTATQYRAHADADAFR